MSDAHHPIAGHLTPGRHGAAGADPVKLSSPVVDIIQVSARKGRLAQMKTALSGAFGLELGAPGSAASGGGITALPIQPDAWMLVCEPRGEGVLAAAVKAVVGEFASVVDQSHGRCMLALAGGRAPEVLARLSRIDLHPSAFGPGRVAVTPLAEMFCVLHHAASGSRYDMIVFSTFADSFLHSVITAAATTGYEIV